MRSVKKKVGEIRERKRGKITGAKQGSFENNTKRKRACEAAEGERTRKREKGKRA